MTEVPHSPQAGIAEALGDLSEQTRVLVRTEIDSARREMWDKAKAAAPALGLAGAAGAAALLSGVSAYRFGLRVLEKMMPPATAAFVATAGFGAGAVVAGRAAAGRLRTLPPLFPTETARRTGEDLGRTAAGAEAS